MDPSLNIAMYSFDKLRSYRITKEEYFYLLPARKICNLNLSERTINPHHSEYYFIGESEDFEDLKTRLRYLD